MKKGTVGSQPKTDSAEEKNTMLPKVDEEKLFKINLLLILKQEVLCEKHNT